MTFRSSDSPTAGAAKTAFSTATAYRLENAPRLPSQTSTPHTRHRPDPLSGHFEEEVVTLLHAAPGLRSIAVFDELRSCHPEFDHGMRRTLERRGRAWRTVHGPKQEVIFRQTHEPGRLGLSDFTDMADLPVVVAACRLCRLSM